MIIQNISPDIFKLQTFQEAAVIDSGFSYHKSSHITLHTTNSFQRKHGTKVLKILSFQNPIHIHLSTVLFNQKDPLLTAFQALPDNIPVLNLSLVWNDHDTQIYDLLFHKFQYVICAYKENTYPTLYKQIYPDRLFTVSNDIYHKADYIVPYPEILRFKGNSAVTPVISNLFIHTPNFHNIQTNLTPVTDIFKDTVKSIKIISQIPPQIHCPQCGYINDGNHISCDICNHLFKKG